MYFLLGVAVVVLISVIACQQDSANTFVEKGKAPSNLIESFNANVRIRQASGNSTIVLLEGYNCPSNTFYVLFDKDNTEKLNVSYENAKVSYFKDYLKITKDDGILIFRVNQVQVPESKNTNILDVMGMGRYSNIENYDLLSRQIIKTELDSRSGGSGDIELPTLNCKCIEITADPKECDSVSPAVPDGADGFCYATEKGGRGCNVNCGANSKKSVACCKN